jgi:hypothetical protein
MSDTYEIRFEPATFGFSIAAITLFLQNRLAPTTPGLGLIDLLFAMLFAVAYSRT